MTNNGNGNDIIMNIIRMSKIQVADSTFIGYMKPIHSSLDARSYQELLKTEHPSSAHVPYCWMIAVGEENGGTAEYDVGFEEDGEPMDSVGPVLLQELQKSAFSRKQSYVLAVVRYFGTRLLGVTCGRLPQCYRSIAALTLHRYFDNDRALHWDFTGEKLSTSLYGLGAGDCEVILDVLKDVSNDVLSERSHPDQWVKEMIQELEFGGFRGNQNEELPRLQNLQADISNGIIPCYRYPGNYRGDEWQTFQWSTLSYKVKKAVEKNLGPFSGQEMNHCVTNYYRDGKDYIGHHSDKDLDLDKEGVIVSVSLGDERILELKRRDHPQDTFRVVLPHGSMLILGPWTNKLFTHSILPKEQSTRPRISLTFRTVLTFLDTHSGRLFGEGVSIQTLAELRILERKENLYFVTGFGTFVAFLLQISTKPNQKRIATGIISTGLFSLTFFSFRKLRLCYNKQKEEKDARAFFSNASVHGTKY